VAETEVAYDKDKDDLLHQSRLQRTHEHKADSTLSKQVEYLPAVERKNKYHTQAI